MDSIHQPLFETERSPRLSKTHGMRERTERSQVAPNPNDLKNAEKPNMRLDILGPMLCVVIPMMTFTAIILGLVFAYQIDPKSELNADFDDTLQQRLDGRYLYVDFSATRLIFIASWSSSIAPLLAGFCMTLWRPSIAQEILRVTRQVSSSALTTPYQLGLVISLSTGSFSQLLSYAKYLLWKPKATNSPILSRTALVMAACGLISLAIFAADTALHYTTGSVTYKFHTKVDESFHQLGRSLSPDCLHFNRSDNFAYPCSYVYDKRLLDEGDGSPVDFVDQFALTSLLFNTSGRNQIQTVVTPDLQHGDLLVLMSGEKETPVDLDYRASTLGVSTQCQPMTRKCQFRNMTRTRGDSEFPMAGFNCTENFWGVLLDADMPSNSSNWVTQSPDIAPFSVHDFFTLAYGYFSDDLQNPYNSLGGDLESGLVSSPDDMIPDSKLINPIGMAVATSIQTVLGPEGDALRQDSDMAPYASRTSLVALNCTFTTYDVEYSLINRSVQHITFQPTNNGTVAEIFHATANFFSINYMSAFKIASLQKSANDLAKAFGNQHSQIALSVIGSVTTPFPNIDEMRAEDRIIARVSQPAIWSLVVANLLFVCLALVLGFTSFRASSQGLQDLTARLSVEGMTALALESSPSKARTVASAAELFEEKSRGGASHRVGAQRNVDGAYDLVSSRDSESMLGHK